MPLTPLLVGSVVSSILLLNTMYPVVFLALGAGITAYELSRQSPVKLVRVGAWAGSNSAETARFGLVTQGEKKHESCDSSR